MHIIRAYHSQRDFLTFDFDLDLFFCFFSCSFMDEITIERELLQQQDVWPQKLVVGRVARSPPHHS